MWPERSAALSACCARLFLSPIASIKPSRISISPPEISRRASSMVTSRRVFRTSSVPIGPSSLQLFRTQPVRQNLIGAYQICEVTLHDRQRVCMQVVLRLRSVDAVLGDDCVVIPVKHLPN